MLLDSGDPELERDCDPVASTAAGSSLRRAADTPGDDSGDKPNIRLSTGSNSETTKLPMTVPSAPIRSKKNNINSGMFNFSNAEAIKEKVRNAKVRNDPYNVHNFYWESGHFQSIARHHLFENVTLGVIVINALWISIDTDLNDADTLVEAGPTFIVADCLFFFYFVAELFIRFMAFKRKRNCLKDGWFVFDTTLVTLYFLDPFLLGFVAAMQGGGGLNLPTAVLRLFRLARLSRLVRMLRSFPQLMIMIKGMVSATTSVGYTLGLLMVITYVFAIALRNLVDEDSEIEKEYFSTVPESMHNLIVFGTFLDALSDFILAIKGQNVPCFLLTWLYIALASLTVMNMLIGILCEVVDAVAEEEKESMMVDKIKEKFTEIVGRLDKDGSGTLSWEEFKAILAYPDALRALESVNIDPESMVDMAEDFFFEDGEMVSVSLEEFMEMVLDLRGGQRATVKDMMGLGKRFNQKFMTMRARVDDLDGKMFDINRKVDQIIDKLGVSVEKTM